MNDSMKEFSPKPTEAPSTSALEVSGIKTVSDRFKGLGEKARDVVAKMVTTKRARAALTGAVIALLISSGCSSIDTEKDVKVTIIKPSEDVTVRVIPAEATPTSGTPEVKSQGLYFDGNHVLVVPHSAELDGKKGMTINISFKPTMPEKQLGNVEGTPLDGAHLVIGGNSGQGGSSYDLNYFTTLGKGGEILYGIGFSAGGLNTGLNPSKDTKLLSSSDQSTIAINATVDGLGRPQLTVNNRKVLGYNFADQLPADQVRNLENSTGSRPEAQFNNNEKPVLVGARLFKDGGADGEFKGTVESLLINGNNIDLSHSNLQEIHR